MADALKCPVCDLWNPPDAARFDCGHAFVANAPPRAVDPNAKPSTTAAGVRAVATSSLPVLGIAGIGSLLTGLYFLVVIPSVPVAVPPELQKTASESAIPLPTGGVVNLHRLSLGETFTISGVILIAAEWRPRK